MKEVLGGVRCWGCGSCWGVCEMFEYTGSVWGSEGVALESGSLQVLPCTGLARHVYWSCDRGSEKLKMLCGVSGVSSHRLAQNMFGEPLCKVITHNSLLVNRGILLTEQSSGRTLPISHISLIDFQVLWFAIINHIFSLRVHIVIQDVYENLKRIFLSFCVIKHVEFSVFLFSFCIESLHTNDLS